MTKPCLLLLCSFVIAGCILTGCGNRYNTISIEGTVLYGEKPVPNVMVTFTPSDNGRPGTGFTSAEGKFRLEYTRDVKGIPPGSYKVSLRNEPQGPPTLEEVRAVLPKYTAEKTPLSFQLDKPNKNLIITLE